MVYYRAILEKGSEMNTECLAIDCLHQANVEPVLKHLEETVTFHITLNQSGAHTSDVVAVATGTRYLRLFGLTPQQREEVNKVANKYIAELVAKYLSVINDENLPDIFMH